MSSEFYYHPNGTRYKIGTIGIEWWPRPEGIFDCFLNIIKGTYIGMIKDIIVPTYGLWAGPGWSGGRRTIGEVDWSEGDRRVAS